MTSLLTSLIGHLLTLASTEKAKVLGQQQELDVTGLIGRSKTSKVFLLCHPEEDLILSLDDLAVNDNVCSDMFLYFDPSRLASKLIRYISRSIMADFLLSCILASFVDSASSSSSSSKSISSLEFKSSDV